jgi:hypothetical protein
MFFFLSSTSGVSSFQLFLRRGSIRRLSIHVGEVGAFVQDIEISGVPVTGF